MARTNQSKKVKHDQEAVKRMNNNLKEAKTVQDKLDQVRAEFEKELHILEQKYFELKKPLWTQRAQKLSKIPEFWSKAIQAEEVLQMVTTDDDLDILKYVSNITCDKKVDTETNRVTIRAEFHLDENPHIADKVLFKQITTNVASLNKDQEDQKEEFIEIKQSGVEWKDEKVKKTRETHRKRKADDVDDGFFTLFEQESEHDIDFIEHIQEALLEDPIAFYLLSQADADVEQEEDDDANDE
jgi:hypothetical protein